MVAELSLASLFVQRLEADGFKNVGSYEIAKGNIFNIRLNNGARNWEFSVYSFVSYADGGKHVRIGKCEGPLGGRLNSWMRFVEEGLNITMPRNQMFKGGTPPWESQGWLEYTVPFNRRGLLFARRVAPLATIADTKQALRNLEKQLQDSHNPPLCNDTAAGRELKDAWVGRYGKPQVIRKRGPLIAQR
jgi:hypothetical protein